MKQLVLALILMIGALGAPSAYSVDIISQPNFSYLWNRFNDVQVIGNYALATSDFGLAVLELDQVSGVFTQINQILLENQATELSVAGEFATVSTTAGILYFVDLSSLPELTLTSQADLGTNVYDALLMGDDLYLACGFQGLRHFLVESDGDIQFVDSSLAPIHCTQVEARGDYLVVLDDYNGLLRYHPAVTGIAQVESRIMVPRRIQEFFGTGDTCVLALVDAERVYRAAFGARPGLVDSAEFTIVPEIVFDIDSFLVAVDASRGRLELMSTLNGRRVSVSPTMSLGLHATGDTYYFQGDPWLLVTSDAYGLAGFDLKLLQDVHDPRQVYSHPGPINAMTFAGGQLLTGGARNPFEAYRLTPPLSAELDTALFTHIDVDATTSAGNLAFVHLNPTNRLQSFRVSADSVVAVSFINTRTDPTRGIKYFDYEPNDTLGLLLVIGTRSVDLVTVSQTGGLRLGTNSSVVLSETITDAIVIGSYLLISTESPELYSYLIFNSFGTVYYSMVATPGSFDHMTFTGPRHAPDGTFMNGIALAFDGNQMYQIFLSASNIPFTKPLGSLPIEVTTSVCTPDALYGIGPQGTVVVDIRQAAPPVLAYGGYGGCLIAARDSIIAVTDGTALHLYVYNNDTFLPVGDSPEIADASFLRPNYPNPFNPRTRIDFMMREAGKVEIAVFDILGRRVTTLIESELAAGPHSVEWSGTDHSGNRVASGIYFYRMSTPRSTESRKMVLLK